VHFSIIQIALLGNKSQLFASSASNLALSQYCVAIAIRDLHEKVRRGLQVRAAVDGVVGFCGPALFDRLTRRRSPAAGVWDGALYRRGLLDSGAAWL
jgi:hypothetical protein